MFANIFLSFYVFLDLHIDVMIAGIHIPQDIFVIDMLTVLETSLEHDRMHVVRLLPLYGDRN